MTSSRTMTVPRNASGNLGRMMRTVFRVGAADERFSAGDAGPTAATLVSGRDDCWREPGTSSGDEGRGDGTDVVRGGPFVEALVRRSSCVAGLSSQARTTRHA